MAHQPLLPGLPSPKRGNGIINVASVPQRSPFRYPGGKTWLVPHVCRWLRSLPERPAELIEPFAGGASVGLAAAFESLADHVTLVELDEQVADVWRTILSDEGVWLAHEIVRFDLTPDNVEAFLSKQGLSRRERALQTIIRNRVNRGGILAPGAGKLKYGEGGKGLASRWYPETLKKRILQITTLRDRFTLVHGDGMEILRQTHGRKNAVFFIDPPYTAGGKRAGSRLYKYADLNHEALFQLTGTLAGDFLMTYDNTEDVREMAQRYDLAFHPVAMKSTHHAQMTELLIGRNLDWIRQGF